MRNVEGIKPSEEMVERVTAAIKNAPAERRIIEQQLRQRNDGTIETLHDRIEFFVVTDESRARMAISSLPDPLPVIEQMQKALGRAGYVLKGREHSGFIDDAIVAAEQFKKEWSGQ